MTDTTPAPGQTADQPAPGPALEIERDGAVEWLTMNRPATFNALDLELTEALYDYFGALPDRPDVRVVVLRGAGRHFCAGFDLDSVGLMTASVDQGLRMQRRLSEVVVRMRRCPQPVIGVMQGAACGGGFALALACDIRFAAPGTRMNVAMARIGLTGCDMGISWFLPRAAGPAVAAELMYTGRFIHAERALRVGLVNDVVPEEALIDTARQLAQEMLALSPVGLRLSKDGLAMAQEAASLGAVIAMEDRGQTLCFDAYMAEGAAAFREKRSPRWGGGQ